jgi:hypothetical protein
VRRKLERYELRIGRVRTRYRLCNGHLFVISPAGIIGRQAPFSIRSFETRVLETTSCTGAAENLTNRGYPTPRAVDCLCKGCRYFVDGAVQVEINSLDRFAQSITVYTSMQNVLAAVQ